VQTIEPSHWIVGAVLTELRPLSAHAIATSAASMIEHIRDLVERIEIDKVADTLTPPVRSRLRHVIVSPC
jgi:hypothetical protein